LWINLSFIEQAVLSEEFNDFFWSYQVECVWHHTSDIGDWFQWRKLWFNSELFSEVFRDEYADWT